VNEKELTEWLMQKIQDETTFLRTLEDRAAKFSVDLFNDRAYISSVSYKRALADVLKELRGGNGIGTKVRSKF
jgi:hypothetical protein